MKGRHSEDCSKIMVVICCKDYTPIVVQLQEIGEFDYSQIVIRCTSILGKMLPLRFIFSLYEKLRKWNDNKECDFYYESNGWTKLFIRSMMGNCLEKGLISM